ENASPYILNISTEKVPSEVMIRFLESKGIFVSGGSACSKGARSHVLSAQGVSPKRIDCAIRISMCSDNTMEEAELLLDALKEALDLVR
ncbi:MAG: aminotransferase class V-fold PLP-dependent enzyme, partial [Clostridia bacterium]|nr:aminotransferase class V-fold PLP-dependent enzyme [Clostridia bacterium]